MIMLLEFHGITSGLALTPRIAYYHAALTIPREN